MEIKDTDTDLLKVLYMAARGSADPSVLQVIGHLAKRRGHWDASVAFYEQALALRPDDAQLHKDHAMALCRLGRVREGLGEYDAWRWHLESSKPLWRDFPLPQWQGEDLSGKHLVLWAEQGVGDQIMQARILPAVVERAASVTFECDPRLHPIFKRTFPDVALLTQTVDLPASVTRDSYDLHGSILSAWRYWLEWHGRTKGMPGHVPIAHDRGLEETFRKDWKSRGFGLNVGISWRSAAKLVGDRKSLDPGYFAPLLADPAITPHCLQYDCDAAEVEGLTQRFGRRLELDPEGDAKMKLDRLMAQIAALDLVVSIDNTTVHLAGAVGTPCIVILPTLSDWRWGTGNETQLYPNMHLIRQTHPERWGDTILHAFLRMQTVLRTGNAPAAR